jgi:hypothetical protein
MGTITDSISKPSFNSVTNLVNPLPFYFRNGVKLISRSRQSCRQNVSERKNAGAFPDMRISIDIDFPEYGGRIINTFTIAIFQLRCKLGKGQFEKFYGGDFFSKISNPESKI